MNFPYGASPYPQPGEVIEEKYEVIRTLGIGGMGAVALATHRLLRSPVALKFLAPHILMSPGAVERFLNEALAARKIRSPHVVDIFDIGRLPSGAPYIVMEYLEGRDLAQILEANGAPGLPVARALHFALQILRALEAAHAAAIVHRDMKPSNCLVIRHDGEDDFVKVVDFGISKVEQAGTPSLTRTNSALGTPLYMSPEQAKSARSVDARSDLYSVGAILYECLTGRTPHVAESGELTEILYKLFTAEVEPILSFRPDLPAGLAAVIHRALAREREDRPASAIELAELLAPFADDRSAPLVARIRPPAGRLGKTAPLPSLPPGAQPVAQSASIPPPPSASPLSASRPSSPPRSAPNSVPVVVDNSKGTDATHYASFPPGGSASASQHPYRTDMAASREPSERGSHATGRRGLLWLIPGLIVTGGIVATAGWRIAHTPSHADDIRRPIDVPAPSISAPPPVPLPSAMPSASAVAPPPPPSVPSAPPRPSASPPRTPASHASEKPTLHSLPLAN